MSHDRDATLNQEIEALLVAQGAIKVGFATIDTLAGGPPSADLTYVLSSAKSAISFAFPLDHDKIRLYLSKKDFLSHEQDNLDLNYKVSQVAYEVSRLLRKQRIKSYPMLANNVYRRGFPDWRIAMHPDISLRYLAAVSGVGSFGWSGNIGIAGYGTAIILGGVVTTAELEPTAPVPPEDGFCTNCKCCVAACASGMFNQKEEESVTLGGVTFTYAKRHSYLRCQLVCGGFSGMHPSGKWSTWSPGRYAIPDDEPALLEQLNRAIDNYQLWPDRPDGGKGYSNAANKGKPIRLTCGNCGILCWGNDADTRENLRLLQTSGCVIQDEKGEILALPSSEAKKKFDAFSPAHKMLYF